MIQLEWIKDEKSGKISNIFGTFQFCCQFLFILPTLPLPWRHFGIFTFLTKLIVSFNNFQILHVSYFQKSKIQNSTFQTPA